MTLPVETIPTSVTLTNNTTSVIRAPGGIVIPASAVGYVIDLSKLSTGSDGGVPGIRGDSRRERAWNGLVDAHRTPAITTVDGVSFPAGRATGLITITATTPNILPLAAAAYGGNGQTPVKLAEAYATRRKFPDFSTDGQGPYISSISTIAASAGLFIADVTFNEAFYKAYRWRDGVTPKVTDFTLGFTANGGTATGAVLSAIGKTSGGSTVGTLVALAGGESAIRFYITVSGTIAGTAGTPVEYVTLSIAQGILRDNQDNVNLAGFKNINLK